MKKILIILSVLILIILVGCGRESKISQIGGYIEEQAQEQPTTNHTTKKIENKTEEPIVNETIEEPKEIKYIVTEDENEFISDLTCDYETKTITFKVTNNLGDIVNIYHGEIPNDYNSIKVSLNGRTLKDYDCGTRYDIGKSRLCTMQNVSLRENKAFSQNGVNKLTAIQQGFTDLTLFECW